MKVPDTSAPRSAVDDKTKTKLVTDALLSTKGSGSPRMFQLERTDENKLNQIYRHEVISVLETILKTNRNLFVILPAIDPQSISAERATFLSRLLKKAQ